MLSRQQESNKIQQIENLNKLSFNELKNILKSLRNELQHLKKQVKMNYIESEKYRHIQEKVYRVSVRMRNIANTKNKIERDEF